jgi:hypothetical protein
MFSSLPAVEEGVDGNAEEDAVGELSPGRWSRGIR